MNGTAKAAAQIYLRLRTASSIANIAPPQTTNCRRTSGRPRIATKAAKTKAAKLVIFTIPEYIPLSVITR
jgi:hypothetical protein